MKEELPMATPKFSARDVAANLEPVLAAAVEGDDTIGLTGARDYATLFTDPDLELYHPENIFQTFVSHFPPSSFSVQVAHVRDERVGDPARMSTCVAALLKAIERDPKTTLVVEIYEEEEHGDMIPRMSIAFAGPGRVPDAFQYAGRFPMTLEELSDCWTLASSGGRIDRTENGVELRLHGMRMPPEPLELAAQVAACIGREVHQDGGEEALALLEDTSPPDMIDLERLYTECLSDHEGALSQAGVVHSYSFGEDFPQLPLNRVRMQRFFASLFNWATVAMPGGGALECLVEYDQQGREATAMISLSSADGPISDSWHIALLKRTIRFHGGIFDIDLADKDASLTFSLGDTVGQLLDEWLPGWMAFGPESTKFLRLLKSGAQAPPEDFILGGILEQELENWLLPRLGEKATAHMASDGTFKNDGLKGSIKERLKKAMDQVSRGKPKKEICQPQYAGELFWAFRKDMRHRSALSTHVLTDEELEAFCEDLLAKPVDAKVCLKGLAALLTRNAQGVES
jgi:hypothetical protein